MWLISSVRDTYKCGGAAVGGYSGDIRECAGEVDDGTNNNPVRLGAVRGGRLIRVSP